MASRRFSFAPAKDSQRRLVAPGVCVYCDRLHGCLFPVPERWTLEDASGRCGAACRCCLEAMRRHMESVGVSAS